MSHRHRICIAIVFFVTQVAVPGFDIGSYDKNGNARLDETANHICGSTDKSRWDFAVSELNEFTALACHRAHGLQVLNESGTSEISIIALADKIEVLMTRSRPKKSVPYETASLSIR